MPLAMVWKKRSSSCCSTSVRALALAAQLGIGVAHLGDQLGDQLVEERLARAELVAVADRAARDAAQHVAAALVARDHAVDDGEGAGADVVGDDLERRRILVAVAARRRASTRLLGRREQRHEQVDLVVRVHVLQHRGQALEAHAGVDARLRQLVHHARVVAVELHEDVVPDLDVAVAVLARASPAGRRRSPGRGRRRSRVHGPHGPVSPIIQKLSEA